MGGRLGGVGTVTGGRVEAVAAGSDCWELYCRWVGCGGSYELGCRGSLALVNEESKAGGACTDGARVGGTCADRACAGGAFTNGTCTGGACADRACVGGACADGVCTGEACADEACADGGRADGAVVVFD